MALLYSQRTDADEVTSVMVVTPVASLAVPITVVLMMPVLVIPIVISTVFVSQGSQ
jgi:hypothetical protein